MTLRKTLLVAVTGHGFGHASQTAPVIDALVAANPNLRIVLRSILPADILKTFIPAADAVTAPFADFGMAMHSAFEVDIDETIRRYSAIHDDYAAIVEQEAKAIAALAPDLVLANVSYLSLAAAKQAGVPSVGFSSLNWLAIVAGQCTDNAGVERILDDMRVGYAAADKLITPTPAMPFPDLAAEQVGPVARLANRKRELLAERLGLAGGTRIAMLSLGGIATALDLAAWPQDPYWHWVIAGQVAPDRPDMTALAATGFEHLDCLASVDVVVTKPGYNTIVEAAVHGIPLVYARRRDWVEEPYLLDWLQDNARTAEVSQADLFAGRLIDTLDLVRSLPAPPIPVPTGGAEAARLIEALL